MAIKKKYLIEKRNVLNELRSNNMKLQELRFFSIYLSKINARDVSTRLVRFPMSDFQKIMDMSQLNMTQLQNTTDNLLSKIVKIPLDKGGYEAFQLFKECRVDKNDDNEWFVEIDAHDKALPLMFEFKERYFTYELWNALRLKSSNQLRMYELLKQYENIGSRTVSLDDLKELLGMDRNDYARYDNFRADVLEICQETLEACTDIKFSYETIKKGRGGKVSAIKFTISKNDNYADPLSLSDFIDVSEAKAEDMTDTIIETEFANERLEFLSDACGGEFSESEMQVLHNLIIQIIPRPAGGSIQDYQIRIYNYLKHRYDMLNMQAERKEIKSRFGYFMKMIESDITE
jgi:plasmid replication initiation protein